jgi:4-hydroxybenzoate polyprenyltransferase
MDDKEPPKEYEPTPKQKRDGKIAMIGFAIFGIVVFIQLFRSEEWSFLAWVGLGYVVLYIIYPKLGTLILFIVIGSLMIYGAITLMDSHSRSERIKESIEGFEPFDRR